MDLIIELLMLAGCAILDRLPGRLWKFLAAVGSFLGLIVFLLASRSACTGIFFGMLAGLLLGAMLDLWFSQHPSGLL